MLHEKTIHLVIKVLDFVTYMLMEILNPSLKCTFRFHCHGGDGSASVVKEKIASQYFRSFLYVYEKVHSDKSKLNIEGLIFHVKNEVEHYAI